MLKGKNGKLFLFGALAGIGTTWLLGLISKLLTFIPGVSVDLQAISISSTGLGGVFGTGLGVYAQKLFGAVGLGVPEMLYTAIGGGLFVLLGSFIVEKIDFLRKLGTTRQAKLATILVVAGIAAGWILSMAVSVPALSAIIIMAVNALVLSYILVAVDKMLKLNIVP